jgi:hypothetical protein
VQLENGHTLRALCSRSDGEHVESLLDLNDHFGVLHGAFIFPSQGWANTPVVSAELKGSVLSVELPTASGDRTFAEIDLDTYIENKEGVLGLVPFDLRQCDAQAGVTQKVRLTFRAGYRSPHSYFSPYHTAGSLL